MNDDHANEYRQGGRLMVNGERAIDLHNPLYQEGLIEAGIIDEFFKMAFYSYPKGPTVDRTPFITSYELSVAFDVGTEEQKAAAARLVWYFTNSTAQNHQCNQLSKFPTRKSVADVDQAWWKEAKTLFVANGILDVGGNLRCYDAIRGSMFPQLQRLFLGKASPAEAVKLYAEALNKILSENQ